MNEVTEATAWERAELPAALDAFPPPKPAEL
jgi:hypothetical protein